jgi:hypothetical protein
MKSKLTKPEWDLFVGIYLDGLKLLESQQSISPKMKRQLVSIKKWLNSQAPKGESI